MKLIRTLIFAFFCLTSQVAHAVPTQSVTIRFIPSSTSGVTSYVLSVYPILGHVDEGITIAIPLSSTRDLGNGVLAFDFSIESDIYSFMTLRAVKGTTFSAYSNEIFIEPDLDSDGLGGFADNCPAISSADQTDSDGDLVGDLCDNCIYIANPGLHFDYVGANPWATLTGSQRDDDHDGYGNVCDGDFTQDGRTTAIDTADFKNSIGKPISSDTCGRSGTKPCAIFDVNTNDATMSINPADTAIYKTLIGKLPGPKCEACPLACTAGTAGDCN